MHEEHNTKISFTDKKHTSSLSSIAAAAVAPDDDASAESSPDERSQRRTEEAMCFLASCTNREKCAHTHAHIMRDTAGSMREYPANQNNWSERKEITDWINQQSTSKYLTKSLIAVFENVGTCICVYTHAYMYASVRAHMHVCVRVCFSRQQVHAYFDILIADLTTGHQLQRFGILRTKLKCTRQILLALSESIIFKTAKREIYTRNIICHFYLIKLLVISAR